MDLLFCVTSVGPEKLKIEMRPQNSFCLRLVELSLQIRVKSTDPSWVISCGVYVAPKRWSLLCKVTLQSWFGDDSFSLGRYLLEKFILTFAIS